jgi:hypothetical protein
VAQRRRWVFESKVNTRLFLHATLISAVFIRLLPALLVAPLQFRATK